MSWAAIEAETTVEYGPSQLSECVELRPRPGDVRRAREFLRECVRDRMADAADVHLLELMVSELVTNAVLHGRTQIVLDVSIHATGDAVTAVLVAVSDRSPALPRQRPASDIREHGRGLQIVSELSDGWGCQALGENLGKIVWFRMDVRLPRALRATDGANAETAGVVAVKDVAGFSQAGTGGSESCQRT
jgi:anti-sigma regulatory factor (Ser/Thr protein kinase)